MAVSPPAVERRQHGHRRFDNAERAIGWRTLWVHRFSEELDEWRPRPVLSRA